MLWTPFTILWTRFTIVNAVHFWKFLHFWKKNRDSAKNDELVGDELVGNACIWFWAKTPQLWNSQLWNLTVFVIWGQNQGCTIGLVSESDTDPIRIGLVIGRTRPRKFWPVRLVNWFRLVNWYPIGRSASSSDRIKRDRTILRTWVDTCRPIKFKAFLINKRPSNAQKLFF